MNVPEAIDELVAAGARRQPDATPSDDEDFRRYLRGEPAPTAVAKLPWLDRIRMDVAAGRVWRRVDPVLPQVGDFFVLEGEHAVRSRYHSECRFVGAEVVNDPSNAAPLVALAELLWNPGDRLHHLVGRASKLPPR